MQVRYIEKGINPPSVNQIYFSGEYLLKGFRIGVVAGMIGLTVSECHNPPPLIKRIQLFVLMFSLFFVVDLSGSHSDWKNICFHERLSTRWKQRNGSTRSNECCRFNDLLLCGHRWEESMQINKIT